MTPEERAALRTLAENATPGPWHTEPSKYVSGRYVLTEDQLEIMHATGKVQSAVDAEYIAAANPAVVLGMLDRIAELEGLVRSYSCSYCGGDCACDGDGN